MAWANARCCEEVAGGPTFELSGCAAVRLNDGLSAYMVDELPVRHRPTEKHHPTAHVTKMVAPHQRLRFQRTVVWHEKKDKRPTLDFSGRRQAFRWKDGLALAAQ
jgi:hypothetical protein